MAFAYILPLRAAQGVLALLVLGLMAYVVDAWYGGNATVNFFLFCSIWTLLALAYLILTPTHYPTAAHKFGILFAEFVTMIFWFSGFIAMAVLWTDIHCGSTGHACGAGTASIVFGAFEWLLFAGTTLMAFLHVWRTRNIHDTRHDPEMEVNAPRV